MIERKGFGSGLDGAPAYLYTLTGPKGLVVRVTNFGGIVTHLFAPDRHGRLSDVALGFDSLGPYIAGHPYMGAIVGRVAGRLTPGSFTIDGKNYPLPLNQGPHHLHGGHVGLDRRTWSPAVVRRQGREALQLSYRSPDGEEGYPGNVDISVTYCISELNALEIEYEAVTDKATPLSLTDHSYFNLGGESSGDIGAHRLQILADEYAPVAADLSHTGQRRPVDGTPSDFRTPAEIGPRIGALNHGHGDLYLLKPGRETPVAAARVFHPASGRTLEVRTTAPCIQFYTGSGLDGSLVGKAGRPYNKNAGFCLECHGYPAAPNFPGFESIIVPPGQPYRQKTAYQFGVSGP
jgi:aldose 1-epimerase